MAVCFLFTSCGDKGVTGVTLDKTTLSLKVDETATLTATVAPDDAEDKSVTWKSSNSAIATVSNGKVTATAVGTATITVTTTDGAKTATCNVTVTSDEPSFSVSFGTTTWNATLIDGSNYESDGIYGILAGQGTTFNVGDESSYPMVRVNGPNRVGSNTYTYGGEYTFDYFESTYLVGADGTIIYGDWDTIDGTVTITKFGNGKISGNGTSTMRDEYDFHINENPNAATKTVSITFNNVPLRTESKANNTLKVSPKSDKKDLRAGR